MMTMFTAINSASPAPRPRTLSALFSVLLPLAVIAALIGLWIVLTVTKSYSSTVFPTPTEVWNGFGEEFHSGRMVTDVRISLTRIGIGFGLAVLLGVPFGLWLGQRASARAALLPTVNFLRSISPLAWIGFAILWFGIGDRSAIFLIFMATVFPMAMTTAAAVANIPTVYFRVARDYGIRGPALLAQVTLPAVLPQIVTSLRVVAGLAWVVVVAAEMAGAQEGLGYAVNDARNGLRTDLLVVAMIVIGVLGVAIDRLLLLLTRFKAVRWGYER